MVNRKTSAIFRAARRRERAAKIGRGPARKIGAGIYDRNYKGGKQRARSYPLEKLRPRRIRSNKSKIRARASHDA